MAGEYVTRPQDVDKVIYEQEGYGPIEGRIRQVLDPTYMSKMKKVYEQGYNEDGQLNAIINKQITDKKDPALEAAEDNPLRSAGLTSSVIASAASLAVSKD